MKRLVATVVVVSLASLALCGIAGVFLPRVGNDVDKAWLTRWRLVSIGHGIVRYYDICDLEERKALRRIQTLNQLWSLFQQKRDTGSPIIPNPLEDSYLSDAWDQPFRLEVSHRENETVFRIISSGKGPAGNNQGVELFVEVILDADKIREKHSWEPEY
jgi:hypothetical protein